MSVTAVLASNGVFRKAMDTQFIIIVDKDTMVSIIYTQNAMMLLYTKSPRYTMVYIAYPKFSCGIL